MSCDEKIIKNAETGKEMTGKQALNMLVQLSPWLKDQLNLLGKCHCGSCLLCMYQYFLLQETHISTLESQLKKLEEKKDEINCDT